MTRLTRSLRTTGLALALSLIVALAAWLLHATACAYSGGLPLCRHPQGGWIVLAGSVGLCWLWVASHLAERLKRRLRRGMYGWVGGRRASMQWLSNTVRFAVEGEWPGGGVVEQHPALYEAGTGWWVDTPIDGGTRVWVDRQEFYEWLVEVLALRHNLGKGESPIAQRLWEPKLGRPLWWAYCQLLEEGGAARYRTMAASSRRLVRFDSWGIMENLVRTREVERQ